MGKNVKSKNCIMAIAAFSVICIIIAAAWLPHIIDTAPLNPVQIGQNNTYVFALPPRYDCTQLPGTEEVYAILKRNPLKTFSISKGGNK